MRRAIITTICVLTLGTAVYAANVHLKGGSRAEPRFTDNGITLTVSGALSGLGNEDLLITLDAMGDVDATCGNPGSNTWQAPGQNPAPISVTGSQAIPAEKIKNGTVGFSVATVSPENPIPGAPDCPNSSWTEMIQDVSFFEGTVTVEQPPGTVVLVVECEISPASDDGSIPAGDVSCN